MVAIKEGGKLASNNAKPANKGFFPMILRLRNTIDYNIYRLYLG